MKLLSTLMLLSLNAFATDWFDLVSDEKYKLTQSFQLTQTERSGSLLDFSAGDGLIYKYSLGIPSTSSMIMVFSYLQCPGEQMETEYQNIPVQGTSSVVKVGVQLDRACELNVLIEGKDVFTKSFLE